MRRLVVGTIIAVLVVLAAAIGWLLRPEVHSYYTDADQIKEPAAQAPLRDVLWQPSVELRGLLNSDSDDYEPRLTIDGMTLYFVRGKAGQNADIYVAERAAAGWGEPQPFAAVNSAEDDLGPEPSADGQSFYFYSNREGSLGGYDLWVSRRAGDEWSQPVNLGPQVNSSYNDYGAALTHDGSLLYFASNRPREGDDVPTPGAWPATLREELVYRTYDVYAAPITERGLGVAGAIDEINSPHNEGSPSVSPWGDFLYFASDRPGGEGGFDLYRTRRLRGGHQAPTNLGRAVNSSANELDPALNLGGYGLYFSSDRVVDSAPPAGPPATPESEPRPDYNLYSTTSREVFADTESTDRNPIDWAGLWAAIGPNLLWAILALLGLLAMITLFRSAQRHKLSLMAKCLLVSMIAHLLLMLMFNTWEVAASISGEFQRGGRVKVSLSAPMHGNGIARQIVGGLTDFAGPSQPAQPAMKRIELRAETPAAAEMVQASVEHRAAARPDAVHAELLIAEAEPMMRTLPITLTALSPTQTPTPTLALPRTHEKVNVAERDVATESRPVGFTVTERVALPEIPAAPAAQAPLPVEVVKQGESPGVSLAGSVEPLDRGPESIAAGSSFIPLGVGTPATTLEGVAHLRTPASNAPTAQAQERAVTPGPRITEAPRLAGAAIAVTSLSGSSPSVVTGVPQGAAGGSRDASLVTTPALGDVADLPAGDSRNGLIAPTAANVAFAPVGLPSLGLPQEASAQAQPAASEGSIHIPATMPEGLARGSSPRARAAVPSASGSDLVTLPMEPGSSHGGGNAGSGDAVFVGGEKMVADAMPGTGPSLGSSIPVPDAPRAGSSSGAALRTVATNLPQGNQVGSGGTEAAVRGPAVGAHSFAASRAPVTRVPMRGVPAQSTSPPVQFASSARAEGPLADWTTGIADGLPIAQLPASPNIRIGAPTINPTSITFPTLPDELVPQRPHMQRFGDDRMDRIKEVGGSEETEEAVALALKWLAAHQSPDGHWDASTYDAGCGKCGGQTDIKANNALTGLSLLCFLGAGHTHTRPGPYQDHVRRAIDWLIAQQKDDGDLRGMETMYSHGIAAIAISESFAMTTDSRLADHVERAMRFLYDARNREHGGWRYDPGQAGDTSVLGWQVMALKSAQMAGVAVPEDAFAVAKDWLERVSTRRSPGLYAYQPGMPPTASMTAEGMFTQLMLGLDPSEPRQQMSVDFVLQHLPDWHDDPNTYFWYYASLALFQHQGPAWQIWNQALKRELVENQRRDGRAAGSWNPVGEWAEVGGRIYQTAICTLMLEVYYRYLPLYNTTEATSLSDIPAEVVGVIRGKVRDFATDEPLAGAMVRLTLPDRESLTVEADSHGGFVLFVPPVPEHFALTATMDGYVPGTVDVERRRLTGRTLNVDFSLQKIGRDVLVLEEQPEVHHLGDNAFSGQINSQFQKQAEGDRYEMSFDLDAAQLPANAARAEIVLMAKGVQRRHSLKVNGRLLDQRLEEAPEDGGFGEFSAPFDITWLQPGDNKIEIIAAPSDSDIDDFEFVNVRVRLVPISGQTFAEPLDAAAPDAARE
jgi:hypothetical protein